MIFIYYNIIKIEIVKFNYVIGTKKQYKLFKINYSPFLYC